ncbi:MAG: STAS/SEC14 domain-containing protein [Chloroflexota bacterium]|nr:MAG: hypothetical protein DIU68_01900 [Chloroflexota bacterium]
MPDTPFTKAWINDHMVVCYRFASLGHEAAEAWYNDIVQTYRDWPPGQPVRLLADLRNSGSLPSPDIVQKVRAVSQREFPDFEGKIAFVLDETQDAKLLSTYIEHVLSSRRERRIFYDEAQAIDWLIE